MHINVHEEDHQKIVKQIKNKVDQIEELPEERKKELL